MQRSRPKHLHRYVAEFSFRYNNRVRLGEDDAAWTANASGGIVAKRLDVSETLFMTSGRA